MFFITIILTAVFLPTSIGQYVNDTPGGSLSWQWNPSPGACPKLHTDLTTCNHTQYEGRWYMALVSLTPDAVKRIACSLWDTYYDKTGSYHDWVYSMQDGKQKLLVTNSTEIPGRPGIYSMHLGNDEPGITFYNSQFYMDTEMWIFWATKCYTPDTQHHQNIAIGIRNLNWVRDKQGTLNRAMKILEKGGYNVTLTPINHENCKYPPLTKNPYK